MEELLLLQNNNSILGILQHHFLRITFLASAPKYSNRFHSLKERPDGQHFSIIIILIIRASSVGGAGAGGEAIRFYGNMFLIYLRGMKNSFTLRPRSRHLFPLTTPPHPPVRYPHHSEQQKKVTAFDTHFVFTSWGIHASPFSSVLSCCGRNVFYLVSAAVAWALRCVSANNRVLRHQGDKDE